MIRFTADGREGPVLGLGLSFANLDLLRLGQPIQFEEQGLSMVIMEGDAAAIAQAEAALPGSRIIGLTPRTLDTLRAGEVITVPRTSSALQVDVLLFAGESEIAIMEAMQGASMITPNTDVRGLDEYHRHEANAVEGCEQCEARRARSWRDWIIDHPYILIAAIVIAVLLLGLSLEA
jgi:hypothetical protein